MLFIMKMQFHQKRLGHSCSINPPLCPCIMGLIECLIRMATEITDDGTSGQRVAVITPETCCEAIKYSSCFNYSPSMAIQLNSSGSPQRRGGWAAFFLSPINTCFPQHGTTTARWECSACDLHCHFSPTFIVRDLCGVMEEDIKEHRGGRGVGRRTGNVLF